MGSGQGECKKGEAQSLDGYRARSVCEKDAKEKRKRVGDLYYKDWMGREEETMSFVASGPASMVKARHSGSDGAYRDKIMHSTLYHLYKKKRN